MNSYHLAIKSATSNGKFIEMGDLWRNYHSEAVMSDSDYQLQTDTNALPESTVQG